MKRKPKTRRKQLVSQLDALFSQFIRIRDKRKHGGICPFPHKNGEQKSIECCFHFVTRSKFSVRWDPRNAVGSCIGCNYENEFNPHKYVAWYLGTHGQAQFEEVVRLGNQPARFCIADLEGIKEDLTQRMEGVLGE